MTELKAEYVSEDVLKLNPDVFGQQPQPAGEPAAVKHEPVDMLITIPEHTCPTLNQVYSQGHWSGRSKLAKQIHNLVFAHAPHMDVPIQVPVHIQVCAHRLRMIDADNVPAKLYIDGLCHAGVLQDDTKQYVDAVTTCCEQGDPHVDIMIWEAGR